MSKSYKIFCSQVSGKEPKLLSEDETIVLKGYNQHQQAFYNFMSTFNINHSVYSLHKFLPKFQGVLSINDIPIIHHNENVKDQNTIQWLQHLKKRYETRNPDNKFIMLENIIKSYKRPNVIDIKLGVRSPHKLKHNKKDKNELFKLNGCRVNVKHFQEKQQDNNEYETLFFSKYFFKSLTTEQEIIQHLALYFFSGQILRLNLLQKTIQKLRQLILALKCLKGWKFYSTSLCIFYDAEDENRFDVKLLDFGRSFNTGEEKVEQATINGLQNFHRFLMQIKNNNKRIQQNLLHMKNKYLKQAILIVPEKKIVQYQGSSWQFSANSSPKKNQASQQ